MKEMAERSILGASGLGSGAFPRNSTYRLCRVEEAYREFRLFVA